jgi:outer membrane protein assembly factor BamB
MMRWLMVLCLLFCHLVGGGLAASQPPEDPELCWPQWRGPSRDGQLQGPLWPDRLIKETLRLSWRVPLGPSYSGPIVTSELVFTTETRDEEKEVVYALDRQSGEVRWRAEWPGAMRVPFFAAANGSWIRSTPAFDGQRLYVAGMRDVLVCLDARSGEEQWRYDFVKELETPLPDFGFVSSPLVDGEGVYVQAGASVAKLDRTNGRLLWRTLQDQGGMFGSAFSSPVIATVAGKRQLIVQTREKLAGVELQTGAILWTQVVPSFRGMNILTPLVVGDSIFTSSYQNQAWLYTITAAPPGMSVSQTWTSDARGYMSSPVVIDGHVYLHQQNQRFTCIDLTTGQRTWTSIPFGKYCSLVAQGNRILALDQRGILLLIEADPKQFRLIDSLKISDEETWAHLAIVGNEIFVRELHALSAFRWLTEP